MSHETDDPTWITGVNRCQEPRTTCPLQSRKGLPDVQPDPDLTACVVRAWRLCPPWCTCPVCLPWCRVSVCLWRLPALNDCLPRAATCLACSCACGSVVKPLKCSARCSPSVIPIVVRAARARCEPACLGVSAGLACSGARLPLHNTRHDGLGLTSCLGRRRFGSSCSFF